jgi:hypothetical protein
VTVKINDPKKGVYEVEGLAKPTKLARATSLLDMFKEGFGGMSYYGVKLALSFLLPDLDEEAFEGVYELLKESADHDPNKRLKAAAARGTAAHKLFEDLCQRRATIDSVEPKSGGYWVYGADGFRFLAVSYDRGAAQAFIDLFSHLDADEMLSEERLFWTEHPVTICPDKTCRHGFAGTADVIIPPHVMGDMKTHKPKPYWTDFMQMALYSMAWEQRTGNAITKMLVIIPQEDGDYLLVDDKFLPPETGLIVWNLYKAYKEWGPVK